MELSAVIFHGQTFAPAVPAGNPAAWQRLIHQALHEEPPTDGPQPVAQAGVSANSVYSALAQMAAGFGGQWSSVLLVGLPPMVDPSLRDYASPWLTSAFCRQKLRVSYWTPDGQRAAFWNGIASATAGASSLENLEEFSQWMRSGPLFEVTWPDPPLSSGFVLDGENLWAAPGVRLPGLDEFADLRRNAAEAARLVRLEKPAEGEVQRVRELLQTALKINPLDAEALRAGAEYYERYRDPGTAAGLLAKLAKIRPADAGLLAELGHDWMLAGDLDAARQTLLQARDSKPRGAAVAEDLANIYLAQHNDRQALTFLQEALAASSGRADLWFTRADAAQRQNDWIQAADSLEKGIAIRRDSLDRRTSLVQLYLEHGLRDQALVHVNFVTAALPQEAGVRRQYAEFLDRLGRPEEALAVWKKALESDPAMEPAHFRIARLLLDAGHPPEALASAEVGLRVAPQSARLHVVKSEALEWQGRYFAARDELRAAAKSMQDAALLARLAEMEDVSGSGAAAAYMAAVDAMKSPGSEPGPVLARGLAAALRDGDEKAAAEFRRRLIAIHQGEVAAWLLDKPARNQGVAAVPGGLEALAFIAHAQTVPPAQFLAEYCRTLVNRAIKAEPKASAAYLDNISQYFQRLAALKALGTARGGRVELEISTADKRSTQKTEKILELLGWRLRSGKAQPGEKLSEASRQEVASALAFDEIAMQEAVAAHRKFTFAIEDGRAPVVLDEAKWLGTFFPKEKPSGGLAEVLARDPRAAKTYAGLATMGERVRNALLAGTDLKQLAEKHADLIYRYSSTFALRGSQAAVPGGPAAEAVWEKVVGSPVASPARFFRALLEKDEGKLLAYFDLVGQLDARHQRFLTLNAARISRFYELFRESPDISQGATLEAGSSSYLQFLEEIPLDADLRVLFPGSPEVWMLAKGKSTAARAVKMARKLSRVTAPEQEDEILTRLLATRYRSGNERLIESDNFVAVVRIDRHRTQPLDEASALLLAQHFATTGSTYPYFASLTELEEKDFELFFGLVEQAETLPRIQLNLMLGQVHSLVELLCLLQDADSLPAKTAAELFGAMCGRFAKAATPDAYATAALDTVRDVLARAGPKDAAGADQALERMLLGAGGPVVWESGGVRHEVDASLMRSAAYRKVLAEQKVTSLQTLLECDRLWRELEEGQPAPDRLKALEAAQAKLLSVPIPKNVRMSSAAARNLTDSDPGRTGALLVRLKQRLARRKVNLEDVRKLRTEFLAAISGQVKLALNGVVYAYFLSPDDLLVSSDPLLIRKHEFLGLGTGDSAVFPASDLARSSEGAGSHFAGGFAEFYRVAGWVAVTGEKPGNSQDVEAAQIGSLRATDWSRFREDDLRVLGLRVRLAREWVLHAAADPNLMAALAEETLGLLSPTRRAELLDGIAARDWESALQALTLSDLYALSGRYLSRYRTDSWQSPVIAALRSVPAPADGSRLRQLGIVSTDLFGCSHPHLEEPGPYEQYERLLLPARLSERTAEFKLYLADLAERVGIPPAALGALAEPLARQVLAKAKMADIRDWRSMTAAFAAMDEPMLEAALDAQK